MLTRTQSETVFADGVEYNTYPPPTSLLKVMKRCYAEQLVDIGSMRFGNLESYRRWENSVLGDPNDGEGMYRMNGHPYTAGSVNPVYAWCASLPEITTERVRFLARYGEYDCLVRIHGVKVFIERVRSAVVVEDSKLRLHCADVSYNRGAEVNKMILNSQKFHFNVFQKAPRFAEDKEYRLSLTDIGVQSVPKCHVDIRVGDCSDIISIENLPNETFDPTHEGRGRLPRAGQG